jgi:hypothetical protein
VPFHFPRFHYTEQMPFSHPPFLQTIVHEVTLAPGLTGLCAGYDQGQWRSQEFADYLLETWLLDFCFTTSELRGLDPTNAAKLLKKAAKRVYETKKFERRGEFGELLLHAALRETFDTLPAISKIYYKDSANDTVKGFDAVHVRPTASGLELWLGEVKFYKSIKKAIQDVIKELQTHTRVEYLRSEFVAITHKIDASWPHADSLKLLLHEYTPLDQVFEAACIPVLLTYDSDALKGHTQITAQYKAEIESELRKHYSEFATQLGNLQVKVHLFLIPLNTKEVFIKALGKKLTAWQSI